jgi:hypothetical protein
MRMAVINTAAHRLIPDSSQAKDWCCHLLGNVNNLNKSNISIALNVFLLLSVSLRFLEGFDDQGGGRRNSLNLGLFCTFLNGQFYCNS